MLFFCWLAHPPTTPQVGQIAFVKVKDYGSVTLSLNRDGWKGGAGPQKKQKIVIEGLTMFEQGWRACSAREYTLEDQRKGL